MVILDIVLAFAFPVLIASWFLSDRFDVWRRWDRFAWAVFMIASAVSSLRRFSDGEAPAIAWTLVALVMAVFAMRDFARISEECRRRRRVSEAWRTRQ